MTTLDDYVNGIICGDCIEVLKGIPSKSIDTCITDPPFVVKYRSYDGRGYPNDDNARWLKPAFAEVYRVLKNNSFCVCFYGWTKVELFMDAWKSAGFQPVSHFACVKPYAYKRKFARSNHGVAFLLAKGDPPIPQDPPKDVQHWGKYTRNVLHPTQMPVEALVPFIEAYTKKDDIVLDPFAGSGTTAVAAFKLGRRFIGIELNNEYCTTAQNRLHSLISNSNQSQHMTTDKSPQEKGTKKPDYYAYKIIELSIGGAPKSIWRRIGSAWAHKDGQGFGIELECFPVDGKLALRTPRFGDVGKEKTETTEAPELTATQ